MSINKELLKYIVCSKCKSELNVVTGKLVCTSCKASYCVENGIPNMLVEAKNDIKIV